MGGYFVAAHIAPTILSPRRQRLTNASTSPLCSSVCEPARPPGRTSASGCSIRPVDQLKGGETEGGRKRTLGISYYHLLVPIESVAAAVWEDL